MKSENDQQPDQLVAPTPEVAQPTAQPAAAPTQPVQQPVMPVAPPQPAPLSPEQQLQSTSQQYFAQPQAAPVQYVVMAESLKGVKGWLLFFVIAFGIAGTSYTGMFFASMTDLGTASNIVSLIFAPIMAALAITTVVFIAMEKQLGKWLAVGTLGLGAVYGVINAVATSSDSIPLLLSGIVASLIFQGLVVLYFFVSKRVKETLVK